MSQPDLEVGDLVWWEVNGEVLDGKVVTIVPPWAQVRVLTYNGDGFIWRVALDFLAKSKHTESSPVS